MMCNESNRKIGFWAVVSIGVGGMVGVGFWLSYVVMLSLYAYAFGSYGAVFLPDGWQSAGKHALISLCAIVITAGLTLFTANIFDLTSISTLGSAGFLMIFAAVNGANARRAGHTNSRGWISWAGSVACLAALGALVWQTWETGPDKLWVLAAMFALAVLIEGGYRLAEREIRLHE